MVNATEHHRAIKHLTNPLLNFKTFRSARKVLAGIELMHLIRKVQIIVAEGN
jgi:transposase-like protein